MIILTLRTDKPEAEIGLFDGNTKVAYLTWQAHLKLAETIHQKIDDLLKKHKKDWTDIGGIVVYKGPGSFTGLRIGVSLANALADSLGVAVVGTTDQDWIVDGIKLLPKHNPADLVTPYYGAPVHITPPKH